MRLYRYTVKREFVCETGVGRNLSSPETVFATFGPLVAQLDREQFLAVFLNGKNNMVGFEAVSTGSLGASIVHPREAFKAAIINNAAAVVFVHNHPSGDPTPSTEDRRITERLRRAGETLGISVLDHVVIGDSGFFSFADNGW